MMLHGLGALSPLLALVGVGFLLYLTGATLEWFFPTLFRVLATVVVLVCMVATYVGLFALYAMV